MTFTPENEYEQKAFEIINDESVIQEAVNYHLDNGIRYTWDTAKKILTEKMEVAFIDEVGNYKINNTIIAFKWDFTDNIQKAIEKIDYWHSRPVIGAIETDLTNSDFDFIVLTKEKHPDAKEKRDLYLKSKNSKKYDTGLQIVFKIGEK